MWSIAPSEGEKKESRDKGRRAEERREMRVREGGRGGKEEEEKPVDEQE